MNELEKFVVVLTCRSMPGESQPIPITKVKTLNRVLGLEFDLLASVSVHVKVQPWTIWLPTLVLIAQAFFRSRTNRQTLMNALPHTGGYTASAGNKRKTDSINLLAFWR